MLNESHLFLVLSGFVAGLAYYTNFYLSHLSYLAFPALQVGIFFFSLFSSVVFFSPPVPTFVSHTSATWPSHVWHLSLSSQNSGTVAKCLLY